jgi:hypothetical protein
LHYRDYMRVRDEWDEAIFYLSRAQGIDRMERVSLDIAVFYPVFRHRDWDNGAPAYKLVQDGLVKAGRLPADDTRFIERPLFPDIQIDKKNPRTEITIAEVR